METGKVIQKLQDGIYDSRLKELYVDAESLEYERLRYIAAIETYVEQFDEGDIEIYSAPGRSEIGGNHTDHQHGEVLAAAINRDAIAIVGKTEEACVKIISEGYELIKIDLDELQIKKTEYGTTQALIRGVLAGIKECGYNIGGFQAYITSDVLVGAGLSSSAAFETLIGTILSYLFNRSEISPVKIAMIGQYAENVYFHKPCGLMDQMASSVGGLVHIDFHKPEEPVEEQVVFDLEEHGYSLCITDTKGSHADLTPDYAAIPEEMKRVAKYFGKEVLSDVTQEEILSNIAEIREQAGDRAVLRAIHFVCENKRVQKEVKALQEDRFQEFLCLVKESGDSSYKYLQNVYTTHDVQHQGVSVGLAVSDMILGRQGVSRVHGGGFAGTIQAFVPNGQVIEYKEAMERVFGTDACNILKIRRDGGTRVI